MRFIRSGTFFKVPTKTKCSQQKLFGIGDGQGMKQQRFLAKGVGGANVSAFFVVLPVAGWEEVGGFRGGGEGGGGALIRRFWVLGWGGGGGGGGGVICFFLYLFICIFLKYLFS